MSSKRALDAARAVSSRSLRSMRELTKKTLGKRTEKLQGSSAYGKFGKFSGGKFAPAIVRANVPVGPRSVMLVLDFASELTAEDLYMVAGEISRLPCDPQKHETKETVLDQRARAARQLLASTARAIAVEIGSKP